MVNECTEIERQVMRCKHFETERRLPSSPRSIHSGCGASGQPRLASLETVVEDVDVELPPLTSGPGPLQVFPQNV